MTDDKPTTITETGSCRCGKVKFTVTDAPVILNGYCHCKNCSRFRAMSPVHLLLIPKDKLTIDDNEGEYCKECPVEGCKLVVASCTACGTGLYQYPEAMPDVRALFPVNFKCEQGEKACKLPKEYLPAMHLNYENRLMDANDNLVKFECMPGGPKMTNDGSIIEE